MQSKVSINKKIGVAVVCYIWITYAIYLILPIDSIRATDIKELYSIVFLIFATLLFYLGSKSESINKVNSPNKYFRIIPVYINILLMGFITLDCYLFLQDLVSLGLATMSLSIGDNYANMLATAGSGYSFWGQLYTLLAPVRMLLFVNGIYNYSIFSKPEKILVWLIAIVIIVSNIAQGQQVGIGNVAVMILTPLTIKHLKNETLSKLIKYIGILVLVFLVYFMIAQFLRADVIGYDLNDDVTDQNNWVYNIFGKKIGSGIFTFLGYFCHGYRGLNYSLQLPFEWTYGYGGSRALDQYLEQYLGFPSMFNDTYPMRVLKVFGYNCQQKWPTAFAWWASDFSFTGVAILMFFIAKLYCKVVKDAYYNSNIYAMAFLVELTIMLIFIPMNNQAFQGRDSLLTTVGLFILWRFKRNKTNLQHKTSTR